LSLLTRSGTRIGPFLAVSGVLHVVIIAVAVAVGAWGRPPLDLDRNIVKTRLVKLGKKRDEKLLPRIERKKPKPPAPAPKKLPEPAPQKKTAEAKKPEPAPAPTKPEPKAAPPPDKPKRSTRDILSDFADDEPEAKKPKLTDLVKDIVEGDEQGSAIGEEITGRLKATYNDKLLAAIKRALKVPNTVSDEERLRLKAVLYVAVGADGSLVSSRITKKSANPAFDNAVLAAAKTSAPFPAPPIQVRSFYRKGVQMNVCPISCR
jgi:TonB family protein